MGGGGGGGHKYTIAHPIKKLGGEGHMPLPLVPRFLRQCISPSIQPPPPPPRVQNSKEHNTKPIAGF